MIVPKWVVTDLDETLLHDDRSISERALKAISAVREMGCKFAIATTRSKSYASKFIEILKPDAMVLSGGALAMKGDSVHYLKPIDREMLDNVMQDLSVNPSIQSWTMDTAGGRITQDTFSFQSVPKDVFSLFLWTAADHAKELGERWQGIGTVTALWQPDLYRLSHVYATKLSALQHILEDVDPGQVFCFGDDLMDVGMLAYFTGVAVENAKSAAKDAASYITKSNEKDGVAAWLEENVIAQSGNRLV
jgi:HAD superfamily hydrolase (TIGR01484 family)